MPGLSGGMAIALLLPVTYSMDPVAALVMLMAYLHFCYDRRFNLSNSAAYAGYSG